MIGMKSSVFVRRGSNEITVGAHDEQAISYASILDKNPVFAPVEKIINSLMLSHSFSKNTGIMPPGVLCITDDLVVFERPPEFKNIFVIPRVMNDIRENDKQETYRIPLPWQLYIVHYMSYRDAETGESHFYPTNVKMHFMKSNLYSIDQELYMVPLPNFYTNGNLCRPVFDSMEDMDRYSKDIAGVVAAAYDWIWNAGTNLDLTESVVQAYQQTQYINRTEVNTIFGNLCYGEPLLYRFNHGNFYCGFDAIEYLLKSWEKFSLESVLNVEWPTNTRMMTCNADRNFLVRTRLAEYLISRGIEPSYELHYDEESDNEYQCEPSDFDYSSDYICECLTPCNEYNLESFMRWTGEYPPKPITFAESCERFLDYTVPHLRGKESYYTMSSSYAKATIRSMVKTILLTC